MLFSLLPYHSSLYSFAILQYTNFLFSTSFSSLLLYDSVLYSFLSLPLSLPPSFLHLYVYSSPNSLSLCLSLSLSFLHFSLSSAILHFTVNPLFSMEYMVDYIKSLCNDYIQHVAHLVLRFRPVYISKMYVTDSLKYYYVAGT